MIGQRGSESAVLEGLRPKETRPVLTHRANQVHVPLGRFLKGRTPPSHRARRVAPDPWVEAEKLSKGEKEESVRQSKECSRESRTIVPP